MNCLSVPTVLAIEPRSDACERLAEAFPDCECEQVSVSPQFSPGPVTADEHLARFVSRHHFDSEKGQVSPSLFAHAGSGGMSVTRIEAAGEAALSAQHHDGGYLGFIVARTGDIRDLEWDGKRSFAVYDTAIPELPSHADVCQALHTPKSKRSAMRRTLQLAFNSVLLTPPATHNARD